MNLNFPENNLKAPLPGNPENKKSGKAFILILAIIFVFLLAGYFLFFSGSKSSTGATTLGDEQNTASDLTTSSKTDPAQDQIPSPVPAISGVFVNNLFIPSSIDTQAVEFLLSLEGQGQLPIQLNENELGKSNPFN